MKPYAVTIRMLSFKTLVIFADSAGQAAEIGQQEWLAHPGEPVVASAGIPYTVRSLEPLCTTFVENESLETYKPPPKQSKGK